MNFSPCIVIPIYNHKETIDTVVDHLLPYQLPIFIIDDGSDEATQTVLKRLPTLHPLVRYFRLPLNGGKGAAVMHGLREAHLAGHTHALQIDADGQHNISDVEHFLALGRANPHAIIVGQPVYDKSAPAGRRYGRLLTHFWVCIETLSTSIGDSMCGFRLYPVAATVALIDRVSIPTRMDFDIEILVRIYWEGIPVINVPTRVIYPEGGLSNFDLLRDNVRISKMHSKLFCGMLIRSPLLLWRKAFSKQYAEDHWSRQEERGSNLGIRFVIFTYRLLGDKAARALLRPIVAWYCLTGHTAREASLKYLSQLRAQTGVTPAPTWKNAYRHMLDFAESSLDKLAAWSGNIQHEKIHFPARDDFEKILGAGRGAILLTAHLGNLEVIRALADLSEIARVNAVVYTEHAKKFNSALTSVNERFQINFLQISNFGPDTAILLKEKIDRGELLVIVGDRTPPADNGRVVSASFLGKPALFPQGPFILASILECPVYSFFCTKENNGYYTHFEPLAEAIELPRSNRLEAIAELVQKYAFRLELLCKRAPFQWFNFFDFWAQSRIK